MSRTVYQLIVISILEVDFMAILGSLNKQSLVNGGTAFD